MTRAPKVVEKAVMGLVAVSTITGALTIIVGLPVALVTAVYQSN